MKEGDNIHKATSHCDKPVHVYRSCCQSLWCQAGTHTLVCIKEFLLKKLSIWQVTQIQTRFIPVKCWWHQSLTCFNRTSYLYDMILSTSVKVKYQENNLNITKPPYGKQIFPVAWAFFTRRFHCNENSCIPFTVVPTSDCDISFIHSLVHSFIYLPLC